jgi:signal transduction histidine kinase
VLGEREEAATLEVFDDSLRRARAVIKVQQLPGPDAPHVEGDFRAFCAQLAAVRHANVATPYAFGTFVSRAGEVYGYTTREYVSGVSLSSMPLPMPGGNVLRVALQVCRALDAIHSHALLHCDLKPENVIVRHAPGRRLDDLSQCVLIDLSYRPNAGQSNQLNEVTLQYVAPEMLEGQPANVHTDLYALGVMLYRLLTGRLPFVGASLPEIMQAQRARDFAPLDALAGAPARLRRAVEQLLEPHPANRPDNVNVVITLLEDLVGTADVAVGEGHDTVAARKAELQLAMECLSIGRSSEGVCGLEIRGEPGAEVTAFLRELQDWAECAGAAVLTAHPRSVGGGTLQEQLAPAVQMLLRRVPEALTGRLKTARTSTELLDDLFVVSQERHIVLFVDHWACAEVTEQRLLERLMLQDRAATESINRRSGRCQLVLGNNAVDAPAQALVAKCIVLPPLQRATGRGGGTTGDEARHGDTRQDASPSACLGSERESATDARAAQLLGHSHAPALLVLALWGESLGSAEWDKVLEVCGLHDLCDLPVERVEGGGVRSRQSVLWPDVVRELAEEQRRVVLETLLRATWSRWWSTNPRELLPRLRAIARCGVLPRRGLWHMCRAMIILLDCGWWSELEAVAAQIVRIAAAPWWVDAFRVAVQGGQQHEQHVDRHKGDSAQAFFRAWVHVRHLVQAREREPAVRLLEQLAANVNPYARCARVALSEELASVAATDGMWPSPREVRRATLQYVGRWMSIARQGGGEPRAGARVRFRAYRKGARVQRVRCRTYAAEGAVALAVRAARRERALDRKTGAVVREAVALGNEGVLLLRLGQYGAALRALEQCVRLQERLDDERGLVIALNNLAAALSLAGGMGREAAVLNRARVVATRNRLWRQRSMAIISLGVAYGRRGQLRDAQLACRQAMRIAREEDDAEVHAHALFNAARVSIERWRPAVAEALIARFHDLRKKPGLPRGLDANMLRAELAYRARDWAHLHTLVDALSADSADAHSALVYRLRLAIEGSAHAAPLIRGSLRAAPMNTRLRVLLLRRRRTRITPESLGRVVRVARRHAEARVAVEWLVEYLAWTRPPCASVVEMAVASLSWFELREGQEDLRIELRAQLAVHLRALGREAEAWRLVEEALVQFRGLERRLCRWRRGMHLLLYLQDSVQQALAGSTGRRLSSAQEISTALCVQAFDIIVQSRQRHAHGQDQVTRTLLQLGHTLSASPMGEKFVNRALELALELTGAQRALIIQDDPGGRGIRYSMHAGAQTRGQEDIAWAVVEQVMTMGSSRVFDDALAAEELTSHRSVATLTLRSLACVPLRVNCTTVGVMYLDHPGIAGLFCSETMGFIELLGSVIALAVHAGQVEAAAALDRQRLVETQRHIMRAERNRMAGELAAGLVHDLKNVLAAISGRAQLLQRAHPHAEVQRSVSAIERATTTGVGLIQRLQESTRDHGLQDEGLVDLAAIAREALDLVEARLEKDDVQATLQACEGAVVRGVAGEFREVLLNLVVNACDAMPGGGQLTVEVAVEQDTGDVVLSVMDTGIGMSEETRGRLFEPFFTTKGDNGTGLGLVVVRNAVIRYGGRISVESEPNVGTRFRVRLPSAEQKESRATPRGAAL